VIAAVFVTLNVTLAGTVILACSLTLAVRVVLWLLSMTWADASGAVMAVSATIMDARTNVCLTLLSLEFRRTRLFFMESMRANGQPNARQVT
jgi:hypothetical protein